MKNTENQTRHVEIDDGTSTNTYTISDDNNHTSIYGSCHKSSNKMDSQYDPSMMRDESYGTTYDL